MISAVTNSYANLGVHFDFVEGRLTIVSMTRTVLVRSKAASGALIAALLAFVPLYKIFSWFFVSYWEWLHDKAMKFELWAIERAVPSAVFFCGIVFYLVFQYLERCASPNERLPPKTLMLWIGVTVVLVCLCAFAYELHTLRQIGIRVY